MADSNDLHQVVFQWPDVNASEVIVTGTFDQWSSSLHLSKSQSGFEGSTKIPWGDRIEYKFVVDGRWTTNNEPTITDAIGNVNNVYVAPPKPASPPEDKPLVGSFPETTSKEAPLQPAVQTAAPTAVEGNGHAPTLSDVVDTIAAREGTTSAVDYVASGLGGAIHSVVGVDPINSDKIPIPSPPQLETKSQSPASEPVREVLSAPHIEPQSDVAPSVPPKEPLSIVPVVDPSTHADEVNAVASPESSKIIPPDTLAPKGDSTNAPSTHTPVDSAKAHATEQNGDSTTKQHKNGTGLQVQPSPVVPQTNGEIANSTSLPGRPSTPGQRPFPGTDSSAPSSPASSRILSESTRKKRTSSIFGKIKHVFSGDKDKVRK